MTGEKKKKKNDRKLLLLYYNNIQMVLLEKLYLYIIKKNYVLIKGLCKCSGKSINLSCVLKLNFSSLSTLQQEVFHAPKNKSAQTFTLPYSLLTTKNEFFPSSQNLGDQTGPLYKKTAPM